MKTLGIIPARRGSKRIPEKNTKDFCGTPLIEHTIKIALRSKIDHIVVTTNDDKVKEICSRYNVDVYTRPEELCTDEAPSLPVVLDILPKYPSYDTGVFLQPTSPLRTTEHINKAIGLMGGGDSVISVKRADFKNFWLRRIDGGFLERYCHDITKIYVLNGAVYVFETKNISTESWGHRTIPYVMSTRDSIDIDTDIDFKLAEMLWRENETR